MLRPNARPHLLKRTRRAQTLRNEMSVSEQVLWRHLRNDRLGYRFRRQYPIGPYTVDFYCPTRRLVIEVDGEQHFDSLASDQERDEYLRSLNIVVIRIPSLDLFEANTLCLDSWLKIIEQALA